MTIAVHEPSSGAYNPFYLLLESVQYFSGPMWWQGLDFRLGSSQELIDLLSKDNFGVDEALTKFAQRYFLIMLERPTYRIRIIAANCDLAPTAPEIFFQPLDTTE